MSIHAQTVAMRYTSPGLEILAILGQEGVETRREGENIRGREKVEIEVQKRNEVQVQNRKR